MSERASPPAVPYLGLKIKPSTKAITLHASTSPAHLSIRCATGVVLSFATDPAREPA
ncbi:MAG TPA: hypothetical protein VKY74_22570 [Chloroflexia bacterium]|nr:hypothetical protein [Chloroflexia bacterium]